MIVSSLLEVAAVSADRKCAMRSQPAFSTAHRGRTIPAQRCLRHVMQSIRHVPRDRRYILAFLGGVGVGLVGHAESAVEVGQVIIRPDIAPDQLRYDPTDPQLRAAAQLLQDALNAPTVKEEEAIWTKIIEDYGSLDADWVPDVVGRAWGNRGNARSRQGKLEAAITDYNKSIEICPWSADPVLNRGAVLEQLGRFDEAVRDYQSVLLANPNDLAAWNNLGNASMGLGNWEEAERCFARAAAMSSTFSFASANHCVALFQLGRTNEAIKEMRALLRRYPDFPDTRAALVAALWSVGKEADAETNWQRVSDPRYRDVSWLKRDRRWPPALVDALQAFLQIRSVA